MSTDKRFTSEVARHQRRALTTLNTIRDDLLVMERKLKNNSLNVDASDSQRMVSIMHDLTEHLAALEMLRTVKDWAESDKLDRKGMAGDEPAHASEDRVLPRTMLEAVTFYDGPARARDAQ